MKQIKGFIVGVLMTAVIYSGITIAAAPTKDFVKEVGYHNDDNYDISKYYDKDLKIYYIVATDCRGVGIVAVRK